MERSTSLAAAAAAAAAASFVFSLFCSRLLLRPYSLSISLSLSRSPRLSESLSAIQAAGHAIPWTVIEDRKGGTTCKGGRSKVSVVPALLAGPGVSARDADARVTAVSQLEN